MGILAKKNMLYLLTFYLAISLLTPSLVFAEKPNFFEEENANVQAEDCEPCIKEPDAVNLDLKKKTEEINREIKGNFIDKERNRSSEIILFIDPSSTLSDGAVDTLVKFKKDHPNWKVRGVILTDLRGLKDRLLQKKSYFGNDIDFSIDLNGNLAREFNVTNVPSFVIIHYGKYYRIAGQPDLNEILSKLDK